MRFFLLGLLFVTITNGYGDDSVRELAVKLMKDRDLESRASQVVTTEQREDLILFLRDAYNKDVYFGGGCFPGVLLVNLNDKEFIDQLIVDYGSNDRRQHRRAAPLFMLCSQIQVVPLLTTTDFVYKDEIEVIHSSGEFMDFSRSAESALTVLSILSRSPDVSDEVHQWAEENKRGFSLEAAHCRDVVRKWWPQNEQFFESGEYGKIRPLIEKADSQSQISTPGVDTDATPTNTVSENGVPEKPLPSPIEGPRHSISWAISVPCLMGVILLGWTVLRFARK